MNNYVLIVEDEEIVRKNMCRIIDWQSLGFEDVYEAEDGLEAYILALQIKPRLIISDILMPNMDGLEFISKIKLELPNSIIIILSGHDDFAYAKKALRLGVSDYILKPVGAKTFTQNVKEILKKYEQRYNQAFELEETKKMLFECLPIMQENILSKLVCTLGSKEYLYDELSYWKISINDPPFFVIIIDPDLTTLNAYNQGIYLYSTKKMISDILGEKHIVFVNKNEEIVVIFSATPNEDLYMLREHIFSAMKVVQYSLQSYLNISTTIAIGSKCESLDNLYLSYNDALTALENRYLLGNYTIYDYYDLTPKDNFYYYPEEKLSDFQLAVKSCNSSRLTSIIDAIFSPQNNAISIPIMPMKVIASEMVLFLIKIACNDCESSDSLYEEGTKLFNKLNKYTSINNIAQSVLDYSQTVIQQLSHSKAKNSSSIVDQAVTYIEENYFKSDLSLSIVAKQISVSSGYLSILFKKEKGVNFSDYVNKIHMEKSIYLLRTTKLTTYQIAEEIGFNNSHYFSLCFKKYTGVSPTEYRDNLSEDSHEEKEIR